MLWFPCAQASGSMARSAMSSGNLSFLALTLASPGLDTNHIYSSCLRSFCLYSVALLHEGPCSITFPSELYSSLTCIVSLLVHCYAILEQLMIFRCREVCNLNGMTYNGCREFNWKIEISYYESEALSILNAGHGQTLAQIVEPVCMLKACCNRVEKVEAFGIDLQHSGV